MPVNPIPRTADDDDGGPPTRTRVSPSRPRFAERYGMEIVNQLAGSLAQSAAVTRQQSTDKSQQVRRAQALRKDVAAAADTFEHQVESTEELTPIHEEPKQPNGRRRQKPKSTRPAARNADPDEQNPRVDVTG